MPDRAVTVIGLVIEKLRLYFTPEQTTPPLGGGTDTVNVLAGDVVTPWLGDEGDGGCGPYLWVRMVRRWRTDDWPAESAAGGCRAGRAITLEAGVARCYPADPSVDEAEQIAHVQWDDSARMDAALCAAMAAAEKAGVAVNTGLGAGDPVGPEGMTIIWVQTAHAQL